MTIATKPITARQKRVQKALTGPQAIPPNEHIVAKLENALLLVDEAWRLLDRGGRQEDCFQLNRFISDLRYRMLPRVRATACSDCSGYRVAPGEDAPGLRCIHGSES